MFLDGTKKFCEVFSKDTSRDVVLKYCFESQLFLLIFAQCLCAEVIWVLEGITGRLENKG